MHLSDGRLEPQAALMVPVPGRSQLRTSEISVVVLLLSMLVNAICLQTWKKCSSVCSGGAQRICTKIIVQKTRSRHRELLFVHELVMVRIQNIEKILHIGGLNTRVHQKTDQISGVFLQMRVQDLGSKISQSLDDHNSCPVHWPGGLTIWLPVRGPGFESGRD